MEIRQGSRQCGSQAQTQRPSWNNFYGQAGPRVCYNVKFEVGNTFREEKGGIETGS